MDLEVYSGEGMRPCLKLTVDVGSVAIGDEFNGGPTLTSSITSLHAQASNPSQLGTCTVVLDDWKSRCVRISSLRVHMVR